MWPDHTLSIQLSIGLAFLMSTAGKLRYPDEFIASVRAYGIVPDSYAYVAATSVVGAEGVIAASHLTGWMLEPAAFGTLIFLMLLLVVVVVLLSRHRVVRCHCFGQSDEIISARTVCRLVLFLIAETTLYLQTRAESPPVLIFELPAVETLAALTCAAALLATMQWLLVLPALATSTLAGHRDIATNSWRSNASAMEHAHDKVTD